MAKHILTFSAVLLLSGLAYGQAPDLEEEKALNYALTLLAEWPAAKRARLDAAQNPQVADLIDVARQNETRRLLAKLEAQLAEARRDVADEHRALRELNRELQDKLDPPATRPATQPGPAQAAQAPTYAELATENEKLRSEVQRLKAELESKPASSATTRPAPSSLEELMRRRRAEMMRDEPRYAPRTRAERVRSASPPTSRPADSPATRPQPSTVEELMRRRRAEMLGAETDRGRQ